MKKFDRMEAFAAEFVADAPAGMHPCYAGYFTCFNRGDYYEAHDVLEHLWLRDKTGPDGAFYQGLIQLAGGFVHLRKQFEHPAHPKHGRRLAPAARLFDLAVANLAPFAPRHHQLDVTAAIALAEGTAHRLRDGDYRGNPWTPTSRPRLEPTSP